MLELAAEAELHRAPGQPELHCVSQASRGYKVSCNNNDIEVTYVTVRRAKIKKEVVPNMVKLGMGILTHDGEWKMVCHTGKVFG